MLQWKLLINQDLWYIMICQIQAMWIIEHNTGPCQLSISWENSCGHSHAATQTSNTEWLYLQMDAQNRLPPLVQTSLLWTQRSILSTVLQPWPPQRPLCMVGCRGSPYPFLIDIDTNMKWRWPTPISPLPWHCYFENVTPQNRGSLSTLRNMCPSIEGNTEEAVVWKGDQSTMLLMWAREAWSITTDALF